MMVAWLRSWYSALPPQPMLPELLKSSQLHILYPTSFVSASHTCRIRDELASLACPEEACPRERVYQ